MTEERTAGSGPPSSLLTHPARLGIALALAGFLLSLALQYLHVQTYLSPARGAFCAVGQAFDCQRVAASPYSVLLGVPVPLLGALGFLAIVLAAWFRSAWIKILVPVAVVASVGLLVVQLVVIGAVCLLCEAVHLTSFALGFWLWRNRSDFAGGDLKQEAWLVFAPSLGILLSYLLFAPRYFELFNWRTEIRLEHGRSPEGHPWIGARTPKLTVEEFSDYSCPFCAIAAQRLLKQVVQHQDSLRLVRRQFPRTVCANENICQPLRVAYCAEEQGRFWQADRWLFAHAPGKGEVGVKQAAAEIGLDLATLERCLSRPSTLERALGESKEAITRRFEGTPTYLIDGKVVTEREVLTRIGQL